MKSLLRNLIKPKTVHPGSSLANRSPKDTTLPAEDVIVAWSEFMGREAAELWVAANSTRDKQVAHRH